MLRKILLSTALVAAAGSAVAADLPYRTAAPAPYVASAPIFTWTGFYAGLNAGASFNNDSSLATAGFVAPPTIYGGTNRSNDAGFTGGAQVGYNMQFGSFVAGVEADINYLDRKNGGSGSFPGLPANTPAIQDFTDFRVSTNRGDRYFGTVRGRLGFAFDRFLVFGTGGLAYGARNGGASVTQRDAFDNQNGTFAVTQRDLPSTGGSGNRIGYALGAGMEYAFSNSMSFKLEYMRVDLGSSSRTFTTLASAPGATMNAGNRITIRNDNKFDIVRAGVNFRF